MGFAVLVLILNLCSTILGQSQYSLVPHFYENDSIIGSLAEENKESEIIGPGFVNGQPKEEAHSNDSLAKTKAIYIPDLEPGQCARINKMEYCKMDCPYRNSFVQTGDDIECNCLNDEYRICEKLYTLRHAPEFRINSHQLANENRRTLGPLSNYLKNLFVRKLDESQSAYQDVHNENVLPSLYADPFYYTQKYPSRPECGKKIKEIIWEDAC